VFFIEAIDSSRERFKKVEEEMQELRSSVVAFDPVEWLQRRIEHTSLLINVCS
jgi:hypothetical protein